MDHFAATQRTFAEHVKPVLRYSTRRRQDILLDYVTGKSVLDLGCVEHEAVIEQKSEWWLHSLIKKRAKSVKGVDYDAAAVEVLKAKGYNVCAANVEDMDLGEKFEVIMAGELVEHLTNHRSFFDSIKRHLTQDGIFVASVPNANSLNYFVQNIIFGHEVDAWDHAVFLTPVTAAVMLKKCGLTPVDIVVYQPDEIFHHEKMSRKAAAHIFNRIQQCACKFRPALARGLIFAAKIASPCDASSGKKT